MSRKLRVVGALLFTCAGLSTAHGHGDDPKVFDREPRYEGPGYRLGQPGGDRFLRDTFAFNNVELLAWMPLAEFGASNSGNDCWGYTSPSGREYAIFGTDAGTAFVEVTNPANPQLLQFVPGPASVWRDVKVYQQYAYIVSEGGSGIQVVSMTNIDNGSVTLVRTVNGFDTSATHNVAINEASGYLYRCGGGDNGLRIYSLANPSNPTFVRAWTTRYVHDAQIVTFTSGPYAGREIAFCCSGFNGGFDQTGLDILDVTDKNNIIELGRLLYPNNQYSHQCWLSTDGQYVYLNDELDEPSTLSRMIIIDVSDLSNPVFAGSFSNGNAAVTHNLYVKGDLIFAANYRSGLRVFDASNPAAPQEIAFFDTYPGSDSANFNGLWSSYPYFPSGTVIGSDIERGLFIWRVGEPALTYDYPAGQPGLVSPAGGTTLPVTITASDAPLDPASVQFFVNTGDGFVSGTIVDEGNGSFDAVFPAAVCGNEVRYYFAAQTVGGDVVEDPLGGAAAAYAATAAFDVSVALADAMETNAGWTVGAAGDAATTGIWNRMDPEPTDAQPGDDHTVAGTQCWVTDGRAGSSLGDFDVDGGRTTLVSPTFDATGLSGATISYWRWYSNGTGASPNDDTLVVEISNNGGSTWSPFEVVGPSGAGVDDGWQYFERRIEDVLTPTAQMRLRFVASDLGSGSIVEAAVDDLEVYGLVCDNPNACPGDLTGDAIVDFADFSVLSSCFGAPCGDLTGDANTDFADFSVLSADWGCGQ